MTFVFMIPVFLKENCSGIKIPRRAHGKGPSKYIPESEVRSIFSSLVTN